MASAVGVKRVLTIAVIAVGAYYAYRQWKPEGLPQGFSGSNGRIEAVEIDVAAKTAGRVDTIDVREGDFIEAGQRLAAMDTATLQAQLREASANLERATTGVETAQSQVRQQEAQKDAAVALVAQRQAELDPAQKDFSRAQELVRKRTASVQRLDESTAVLEGAKAALSAAKAQVAAADAAISYARSGVVAAQSNVAAAKATIERIQADIDDSTLRAPRDGRVQYRWRSRARCSVPAAAVLNLVDLTDVYMTFFLPTEAAGRVALGDEVRIVLDAAPQYVIPARVSFVADVAQFTPKTVETAEERQKLMFRVKARIDRQLLKRIHPLREDRAAGHGLCAARPGRAWPDNLASGCPMRDEASGDRACTGAAPVARLRDVGLRYGKVVALEAVSLDLPAGCMVGLIGPDGVGKSSLLALIAGARAVQAGRVEVLGGDMADAGHRRVGLPAHRLHAAGPGQEPLPDAVGRREHRLLRPPVRPGTVRSASAASPS